MGVRGEIMMIVSLLVVMSSTAINIPATCVNLGLCARTQEYLPPIKPYPPVVGQNQQVLKANLVLSIAASIANKSSFDYMDLGKLGKANSCLSHLSSKLARVRDSLDQFRSQINQHGMLSSTQQIFLKYNPQDIVNNIILHAQDPCNEYYKRGLKKLSGSPNNFLRGAAKGGLTAIDALKKVNAADDFFTTIAKSIKTHPLPHV